MSDTIIAEIRKTRDELARQCNFDLHQMCVELRREQELSGAAVVSFSTKSVRPKTASSVGQADSNKAAVSSAELRS